MSLELELGRELELAAKVCSGGVTDLFVPCMAQRWFLVYMPLRTYIISNEKRQAREHI